jgi:hypothetical protein
MWGFNRTTDSFADAFDEYLPPNYEHIESGHRNEIFKLNLRMSHDSHHST